MIVVHPAETERANRHKLGSTFLFVMCVVAAVTVLSGRNAWVLSGLGFLILLAVVMVIAVAPVAGLYASVFFALISDAVTIPWFPFIKNFSGQESIMYLTRALVISPFDVVLGATLVSWLFRVAGTPHARPQRASLTVPVLVFTAFVGVGYLRGLSTGANVRVALTEGRALFYLPIVYILVINLCGRRELRGLMWTAAAAVGINAVVALWYLSTLSEERLTQREDLGQHSAAVSYSVVLLLLAALWMYRGSSRVARWATVALAVPITVALIASQRRASMIGLGVTVTLLIVSLLWRDRRRFWKVWPVFAIAALGYCAAFWNSTSSIAIGAQGVKSVIAPDQVTSKDASSDAYRVYENIDLNYTIRQSPVLGLGFGKPFYRPIALPAITQFPLSDYVAHNSILWMWVKVGFFGFFTMMWLFAVSIRDGIRRIVAESDPTHAAVLMAFVGYIISFAIFTFVDISWDPSSVLMLAVALATVTMPSPRPATAAVLDR